MIHQGGPGGGGFEPEWGRNFVGANFRERVEAQVACQQWRATWASARFLKLGYGGQRDANMVATKLASVDQLVEHTSGERMVRGSILAGGEILSKLT